MAQVDAQYINLGVLNPLEVREARFGGTEYSIDTTLNEAVTEQLVAQTDASFQSQMAGYEAQLSAASPDQAVLPPAEEEADPEQAAILPPGRGDASLFDHYEAHGLRIAVSHELNGVKAGYLVGPDGQRTDATESAPLMVFGPNRTKAYKLYRARFVVDGALIDGPYATGFASLRAAKSGINALFPRQTVAGLSPVPEGEVEALRAAWETY